MFLGFHIDQIFAGFQLMSLVRIVVLIFIGFPVLVLLSKSVRRYTSKKLAKQQGMIFEKIILYTGVIIIAISILNELGFKISHLLGAAGIIGIAVGFASQTSVSNIISGLFLIAEKPFEVDDVITVGSTTGVILSIDTLSIKLRTFDNKYVRIPNEILIKTEFTNITRFPIRRVDLMLGVAYKEDIARVREVLLDIAHKNPFCLNEPEPLIIFVGFGSSSIDVQFSVWAAKADWLTVKNTMLEDIKRRFDKEGIEIPFPHLSHYKGSATEPIPITLVQNQPGESSLG